MAQRRKFLYVILTALILTLVLIFYWAIKKDDARLSRLQSSSDPKEIAALVLDNEEAQAAAALDGHQLLISYRLEPWSLTSTTAKSAFNLNASKLVPALFSRVPSVDQITIDANYAWNNQARQTAISATFSRATADAIERPGLVISDIPSIAESYWTAPLLN